MAQSRSRFARPRELVEQLIADRFGSDS